MILRAKLLWRRCLLALVPLIPRRVMEAFRPPADPKEAERRKRSNYRCRVTTMASLMIYELRHEEARFCADVLKELHRLLCLDREPTQQRLPERRG